MASGRTTSNLFIFAKVIKIKVPILDINKTLSNFFLLLNLIKNK